MALRLGGGVAACEIMTTPPDAKTHKMMGKYDMRGEAGEGGHGDHERVRWLVSFEVTGAAEPNE